MPHSVLAQVRLDQIKRNGVAVAAVEDALPRDYYEALAASFPAIELIAGSGPLESNRAYRMAVRDVLGRQPALLPIADVHDRRAEVRAFLDTR